MVTEIGAYVPQFALGMNLGIIPIQKAGDQDFEFPEKWNVNKCSFYHFIFCFLFLNYGNSHRIAFVKKINSFPPVIFLIPADFWSQIIPGSAFSQSRIPALKNFPLNIHP